MALFSFFLNSEIESITIQMFQEKTGSHAEPQTTWQNKNVQHDAASKHLPIQKKPIINLKKSI